MLALHVGPHKTATTYIQNVFFRNSEVLKENGWLYPEVGTGHHRSAHHDIAHNGAKYLEPGSLEYRALAELRGAQEKIVLSAEGFRVWNGDRLCQLADILNVQKFTVAYVVRDPISLFWSYWSEEVKQGYSASLPERFAECFNDPFQAKLLNPMIDLRSYIRNDRIDLKVIPYDVMRADDVDIAGHMAQTVLGLDDLTLDTDVSRNASMPVEITELLRLTTLIRGAGARRTSSAFRLKFMQLTKGPERREFVKLIKTEGRPARRTISFPEAPRFLEQLEAELKTKLARYWTVDVTEKPLFPAPKLEFTHYNAAVLMNIPAIRQLVDETIALVEPMLD